MDFVKNARNVVTPIRKAISLGLNLDKYFHQIDSIPSELISPIALTTENNSSFTVKHTNNYRTACLQSQKRDPKRENTVEKVSINQLIDKLQL